jgi:hypothetical protein
MGYGAKALSALASYYTGEIIGVDEVAHKDDFETFKQAANIRTVSTLPSIRFWFAF